VSADARPVRKASETLAEQARITLAAGDDERFVSRGGLKLAGARSRRAGSGSGRRSAWTSASRPAGFTDCLLQAGATRVVGVDVGTGSCIRGCGPTRASPPSKA